MACWDLTVNWRMVAQTRHCRLRAVGSCAAWAGGKRKRANQTASERERATPVRRSPRHTPDVQEVETDPLRGRHTTQRPGKRQLSLGSCNTTRPPQAAAR
jgi:hypothetical protein